MKTGRAMTMGCITDGRKEESRISFLLDGLEGLLLKDKTTKKNIKWGTDNYLSVSQEYMPENEMKEEDLSRVTILPRVMKSQTEQLARTRDKAEVFTPGWVCALQNNLIDEAWFSSPSPFCNISNDIIEVLYEPVTFPEEKKWQDYVEDIRLEITCGEAPYLISRYDVVTGETIPVKDRLGILDRKLRVVSENCNSEEEWVFWARKAMESSYGYDFQGDNVYLARKNMIFDYAEHMEARWGHLPDRKTLRELCNLISWNIWQMDGITNAVPFSEVEMISQQEDLFGFVEEEVTKSPPTPCRVYDWKANRSVEFRFLMR